MSQILCVTGTGTEIGKTTISLAILLWAREHHLRVQYLKIVQCGSRASNQNSFFGDADWIEAAVPGAFGPQAIYTFIDPVSPHLAAERSGAWIDPEWVQQQVSHAAARCDLLVLEGAGGAAVPLTRAGLTLPDLAASGKWPCLIATLPGLGTLHQTLATAHFIHAKGARIIGFAMREELPTLPEMYDDNVKTLSELLHIPHFGTLPFIAGLEKRLPLPPAQGLMLGQSLDLELTTWWNNP